jgi:multiple antibiotic resistance protein
MNQVHAFGLAFVAFFVALDVIGMLPLYLGMTHAMSKPDRDRITDVSMFVAFAVAVAFALVGETLFHYVGITISDFKIAGGIVLLLLSLAELANKPEAGTRASGSTGVVPLAVPLITGPAVLTTLILQVNSAGYLITLLALLINYALAWVVLRQSLWVVRIIGKDGATVFSKIAALLLAAISVAMIRGGVFEAISEFGKRAITSQP